MNGIDSFSNLKLDQHRAIYQQIRHILTNLYIVIPHGYWVLLRDLETCFS